ncbi:MAG TPA: hypothetical protein VF210_04815 [Pseudomonadales bacterium]
MRSYWQFYWPLALTGLAMVLSIQFQNAALARYPEAARELAVFALAYGTFGFFRASLNFVSQLSNVYARSRTGARKTLRFVIMAALALTGPLAWLGFSASGEALLQSVYHLDTDLAGRVTEYLRYLTPLVLVSALRFYYTGLLIQARLTGSVTLLNVMFLSTVILGLVAGFAAGLEPVLVLVGSEGAAMLLHLAGTWLVKRARYQPPAVPEHVRLTYRELTGFFVPVSTTGVMFALSRPVLYAFVSRTPDGVLAIAALRVAFDFSMLFQQAANQFRHFFVTFGLDDLPRKRRFMALVCAGLTALMLTSAITPLSALIWRDLMRIPEEVRALSVDVILVLCLMPAVIVFRNYFHGRLMVERRTVGMAAGAILRVVAIYALAQALFTLGWLNHVTAAAVLILGFVVEALVVVRAALRPLPSVAEGGGRAAPAKTSGA